ncbi:MAG: ATP-binding protein [Bacteroidota bacterium]
MTKLPQMELSLEWYLRYLAEAIQLRLDAHFEGSAAPISFPALALPSEQEQAHPLAEFIRVNQLQTAEVLALLVALAPHIQATFFDAIIRERITEAGDFPEFGGVRGKQFRGFLPTGETVLFLLAGNDLSLRFHYQQLFEAAHLFVRHHIVWLDAPAAGEPRMSGKLRIDPDYIDLFTTGRVRLPQRSVQFPAEYISTELAWSDLILPASTRQQIKELEIWIDHHATLLYDWEMEKRMKPGYRALFYGPPGTGKTLTASLLGKYTGRAVFRIDLSMVVSKYIGETEKNLASLFDKAQNKNWILFFDEADAIFGKRTSVRDAHDKYANQEVSYLLQRIESYPGLTILASNFKSNLDDAFTRRFQAMIHFPMPEAAERLRLWQQAFPKQVSLAPAIDLPTIARKYELSGSNIMNIVQYCCLQALDRETTEISLHHLMAGIKNEFYKEGKAIK